MSSLKRSILILTLSLLSSFPLAIANQDAEEIFTYIYDNGIWGRNAEGKGFSGGGSLVENAQTYMNFLQEFLKANEIKTVVDVGCGDWTFSQNICWEGIQYTGYDVVRKVIDENIKKFSNSSIKFIQGDLTHLDLPNADLLICKDVLQHLPHQNIFHLLQQAYKYKYCLITNDVDPHSFSSQNNSIQQGEYRTLDLTKAPFNVAGIKVLTYRSDTNFKQVLLIVNR
jgi:SAM-dependent methyltransferase